MKTPIHKISLPISPELVAQVDKWRGAQEGVPNRSEAIRRMIVAALERDGIEVPENVKG
jgi:metal-responsive CopG/Arc/MetJ family transcriptional regulator